MHRKVKSAKISGCLLILVLLSALCIFLTSCRSRQEENGPEEDEIVRFQIKASERRNYAASGDGPMSASYVYANSIANAVQGFFTDHTRNYYALKNLDLSLVHRLGGSGKYNVAEIANAQGVPYTHNSLEVYIRTDDGTVYSAGDSQNTARVNTTRFGYYYYETHVRDLDFSVKSEQGAYLSETPVSLKDLWGTHQMELSQKDGAVSVTVEDPHDPYVYYNGLTVAGGSYNAVEVEMKAEGIATKGQLYFYTQKAGNFNAGQSTTFSIQSDGQYHKYLIDLSAAGMDGTALCGVRFDLGETVGDAFTIRSVKAVKMEHTGMPYKLDKTFHMYSDKLHQEYLIQKIESLDDSGREVRSIGVELRIPKESVLQTHIEYEADGVTPVYAAVDVKDAGVIGFILPSQTGSAELTVAEEENDIVLRHEAPGAHSGNRIYNDMSHDFAGIQKASYEERHPLQNVTALNRSSKDGRYLQYDALRGAYQFTIGGVWFNEAYQNPNGYFQSAVSIENDTGEDRSVYIWTNGTSGCLECAAVADETGTIVPVPTQVCKNFVGEYEEPFYDPEDLEYGDSIIPLSVAAGQKLDYTLYHLYQNWGKFPLKQLSSIQFFITYYHLSTGVTESNCIAPYFVNGRDQWTLPDFRGCSGVMWAAQPQFDSVGRLRFVSYKKEGKTYAAEYAGSEIRSSGTSYADLDYRYRSDCGSYEYTLRHIEFPQNDENRTYYSLRLEFLKDLTIEDVKNNFTLFSFDGRELPLSRLSYLDESGRRAEKAVDQTEGAGELLKLGKDAPYFSYFGFDKAGKEAQMENFAYLIKSADVRIGGEAWNGNFVLRNGFTKQLNLAELSLYEGDVTFRKGDHIYLDFILLPWGGENEPNDDPALAVRKDSVLQPLVLTPVTGTAGTDPYLPEITAEQNMAEFTLAGGRNRFAVRVNGITAPQGIRVEEQADGGWKPYRFQYKSYDGYQIQYQKDGTYSYIFIIEMDREGSPRTFRVTAK